MIDDKFERCSALIDGELPGSEAATLIADLGRDKSVRETVGRFYLIGDAVRNAVPEHWRSDFVSNVMKAVEEEPFWLLSSPESQAKKKWLVGGAIAASVCVFALFMSKAEQGQAWRKPALIAGQAMQLSEETRRISSAQTQSTSQHPLQTRPTSTTFAGESRLNSYLVKHNQYLDNFTVQGVAPYARVVGYQGGR
ncbi:MAG: sigma-E factor negative regulatory protein [Gammaproteobacteria bacterium]